VSSAEYREIREYSKSQTCACDYGGRWRSLGFDRDSISACRTNATRIILTSNSRQISQEFCGHNVI
jgi:hypothetical protein